MKKFLFIALICILAVGLFAGTPRSYIQKLMYQATYGGALLPLPDVTNTSSTTATNYRAVAYLASNPTGILTTGVQIASTIRIYRGGNGGTVPYYGAFGLQLGSFPTPWVALDVVHVIVTYLPTMETCSWDMTIPDALTTTLQYTTDTSVIPYVLAPPIPEEPPQIPLHAVNPSPYMGEVIVHNVPYDQTLTWEPNPVEPFPDGYHVYWNGVLLDAELLVTFKVVPVIAYGIQNWQIIPYIVDAKGGVRDLKPVSARASIGAPKGDATDCPVWNFTVNPEPPTTITMTIQTDPAGAPVYLNGILLGNTPQIVVLPIGVLANFTFGTLLIGSNLYSFDPYSITPVSTDEGIEVIVPGEYETVPVELTSFAAIYSQGFFVNLTWIVASETNHMGYYVLRNDSADLDTAASLNPTAPISDGTVSGTQITYNYQDDQIEKNQTYYYWLESVDLNGASQFFGPISVIVTPGQGENPAPVVPMVTALNDAYPNPFSADTRINYTLSKDASVRIDIYNVRGQMIKTFTNQGKTGNNWQTWDGTDMNGKNVKTGIYYYRMTSGKYTASKKIVLVK